MTLTTIVIGGAAVIVVLEATTAFAIGWLRKSCAWLIVGKDRLPDIDPKGLDAFMRHGWDPQLGWVRKPNTQHNEIGKGGVTTSYSLDDRGARTNPGFENRPIDILAYGDSYAFARQVNDDESWAHFLSVALDRNVANFGVGNYGIDQAQLRLEREFVSHPAKVVIMTVVPETICRIHSFWKHFSEYGNTFAFKPRFLLNSGQLEILPNLIDSRDKYFRIEQHFDQLARHDYFYRRKFCRDILKFPYLLSLARSWKRNLPLMKHAFTDRIGLTKDASFINIMNGNINLAADLFRTPERTDLFYAICERFKNFCRDNGAEPVLVMVPQLMDMKRIRAGDHYYADFLEKAGRDFIAIDLAPALIKAGSIEDLYIHDRYGGHLSAQGNRIAAKVLDPVCRELAARQDDKRK